MIKFGIKAGVAGAVAYYLAEQGVWKDTETTYDTYKRLNTTLTPYVKQAEEQLPFEVPRLPERGRIGYLTRYYWNRGVMSTFEFLADLPKTVDVWLKKGVDSVMKSLKVKEILDSSGSPGKKV